MRSKQTGFATITLTVLLLSVIILVTLYTARFKMQEQRIMRNHAGMQEATMVADAALEQVVMLINSDKTNLNRTLDGNIAGAQYQATLSSQSFETELRGDVDIVDIVLNARSADGRATRLLRQQVAVMPIIRSAPDTPIAIKGGMVASGNFQVVANPNGGGDGVPLSIWTDADVDINGSGSTCGQEEFEEGICSARPFSERGQHGVDILDNDTENFPDDLLEYLFGVREENWQDLRDMANVILPDCSSLNAASTGLIWVEGNCDVPSAQIGTADDPVALVVHNGNIKMNANTRFYGMLFAFDNDDVTEYDMAMNGGAVIHGAVMANQQPDLSNGTLMVHYHLEVLSNIVNNDNFRRVHRVGGSWSDF